LTVLVEGDRLLQCFIAAIDSGCPVPAAQHCVGADRTEVMGESSRLSATVHFTARHDPPSTSPQVLALPAECQLERLPEILRDRGAADYCTADYWRQRALTSKDEWRLFRRLAGLALQEMGWKISCPRQEIQEVVDCLQRDLAHA
jgi:hypothetical protein